MNTSRLILLTAVLIVATSCTRFIMILEGIHKPRPENENTIRAYSQKMDWTQDNIYVFADSNQLRNYYKHIGSLPWISFYNKDMYLLKMREKDECPSIIDSIIYKLHPGNVYPVDSTSRLSSLVPLLCNLDGNPLSAGDLQQSDFYVVLYWAIFAGHLNKRDVKVWEEQLYEKAKTMGITVLKVNCDFRESWLED